MQIPHAFWQNVRSRTESVRLFPDACPRGAGKRKIDKTAKKEKRKMDKERFEKQVAFILEADKEKNILRQTHISGHGRRENDAEHPCRW